MNENQIFEVLRNDCNPYLKKLENCKKGHFLLRGYDYEINDIKAFDHPFLEKRKPRNMSQETHDKINNHFLNQFNWKIRNGVFCYGFDILNNTPINLGYGVNYLFFPIGDFDFVYNLEHFDLWAHFRLSKIDEDEIINSLHFENDNFCDVMNTRKEFDNFGNEVSVKVDSYYLVNTNLAHSFSSKIWD